jgi:hypothetical protein
MPASQLGCASDLLSAIIVPVVIRYVETGELPWGWNLDLESMAFSWARRVELRLRAIPLRRKIARQLRELP